MSDRPEGKGKPRPALKQVRIRPAIYEALERLVERNSSDLTEEVNRLIRVGLEREGLWPPPLSATQD